jgi:putative flippase GtrA
MIRPEHRERLRQPAAFIAVGVTSAVIDGGVFLGLVALGLVPWLASVISFSTAFTVNYLGNRDLTFRAAGTPRAFRRYVILVLVNLALSGLGVWVLVGAGLRPWEAKLAMMIAVALVNFLVLKRWVFRQPRHRSAPQGAAG